MIPEKSLFQECLLYWLTSLLAMRSLPVRGPTIINRKVPLEDLPVLKLAFPKAS